mmetsp:Transcript_39232/g.113378  ORF Transcript_39232/g.113378 Transcript_39232/m.113378 type:complete len:295 (+) Transcript_39232:816-1700(+)
MVALVGRRALGLQQAPTVRLEVVHPELAVINIHALAAVRRGLLIVAPPAKGEQHFVAIRFLDDLPRGAPTWSPGEVLTACPDAARGREGIAKAQGGQRRRPHVGEDDGASVLCVAFAADDDQMCLVRGGNVPATLRRRVCRENLGPERPKGLARKDGERPQIVQDAGDFSALTSAEQDHGPAAVGRRRGWLPAGDGRGPGQSDLRPTPSLRIKCPNVPEERHMRLDISVVDHPVDHILPVARPRVQHLARLPAMPVVGELPLETLTAENDKLVCVFAIGPMELVHLRGLPAVGS